MKISIIIPTLDEADNIVQTLSAIIDSRPDDYEVIVVDGGSKDNTRALVADHARIIDSGKGRAAQMNKGAAVADGDVLLFLHADTLLPKHALQNVVQSITEGKGWGRFEVRLSGDNWMFRIIETMMNWRSCITSVATGDQAIFVDREMFERIGGYPDISLMEDIELCKRLRRHAAMKCLRQKVVTSSRRWQQRGILKTVLLMWWLRLLYFLGVSPEKLAAIYR